MITRDNVREVFDNISKEGLDRVMKSKHDMCLLTVNGYGWVNLSPSPDFKKDEQEAEQTGGIHCDKDDLLRLFVESGSKNPFFVEYL